MTVERDAFSPFVSHQPRQVSVIAAPRSGKLRRLRWIGIDQYLTTFAVDEDAVPVRYVCEQAVDASDCGDTHRAGQNRGVTGRPATLEHQPDDMCPIEIERSQPRGIFFSR